MQPRSLQALPSWLPGQRQRHSRDQAQIGERPGAPQRWLSLCRSKLTSCGSRMRSRQVRAA